MSQQGEKKSSGLLGNLISLAVKIFGSESIFAVLAVIILVAILIVLIVIIIGFGWAVFNKTGELDGYQVPDDIAFDIYVDMYGIEDIRPFVEPTKVADTSLKLIGSTVKTDVYYGARIYPIAGVVSTVTKRGANNYSITLPSNNLTVYIRNITHISKNLENAIRQMLFDEWMDQTNAALLEWYEEYKEAIYNGEEVPQFPISESYYDWQYEEELAEWMIAYEDALARWEHLPNPPIPEKYFNEKTYSMLYGELKNGTYKVRYYCSSSEPVAYAGRLLNYDRDDYTYELSTDEIIEIQEEIESAPLTLQLNVDLYDGNGSKYNRFETKMLMMYIMSFSLDGEFVGAIGAQEFIEKCVTHVGLPYVWGEEDLNVSCDCSGFTQQTYLVYQNIEIPRTAKYQINVGTPVPASALRPGDLVFFNTDPGRANEIGSVATHVGIYIGNDMFVHSAGTTYGNIISRFSGRYQDICVGGRRYLQSTDFTFDSWSVGIERITRADIDALASFVAAETAINGLGEREQQAIAGYIFNKTISGKFGTYTLTDTINNATEFKSVSSGSYKSYAASDAIYEIVYSVLCGKDITSSAIYMKYVDDETADMTGKQYTATLGNMEFYKDYENYAEVHIDD